MNISRTLLCELIPLKNLREESIKKAKSAKLAQKYKYKNKIGLCRLKHKDNKRHVLSRENLVKIILTLKHKKNKSKRKRDNLHRISNKSKSKIKNRFDRKHKSKMDCIKAKKKLEKLTNLTKNLSKSKKISVNRKKLAYSKLKKKTEKYLKQNC